MGDQREILLSSEQSLDIETIRSRVKELSEIHRSCKGLSDLSPPPESEKLMEDCVLHLGNAMKQITAELLVFDSLGPEELDAYLEKAKEELKMVEAENAKISNEIEVLTKTYAEESTQMESDLDGLNNSLEFIEMQGPQKLQGNGHIGCSISGDNQKILMKACDYNFEILELDHQIEKKKIALGTLQDLESVFRRVEAIQQIEDALTSLKIIDFEGNHIRLSLKTFIPTLEDLPCPQKMEISETLIQEHELLIEVIDGTMDLKNVEIFPNDVFIGELIDAAKSFRQFSSSLSVLEMRSSLECFSVMVIDCILLHFQIFPNDVFIGELIDAAKSFRQFSSSLSVLEMRSSLEWFVRKVQDRIRLCTVRRLVVKCANNLRHSFEYSDRDDIITAHMVGGIDAFIKISQGWPLSNSPLKLLSLKSSNNHSQRISLSFLCKVEELVNSLDVKTRKNLSIFVDAVEEILLHQTRSEFECNHIPQQ
ncbi:hypothetical protein NE237_015737 [Protea cynaroides]|uniref:Uncharacterized protein n=1 Tax=Protea cynaroides TaxID=273540 RepID=A0A9Q0KEU8_9MAGN|nr:hypothetical protein NE237_015737 [Protea cynaroides]